ncbi:MAG: PadR family transcriptional regulator [Halobacteriaceae archaeon]
MGRWLHSGLRRDICVVVAALDGGTDRAVKAALERHYEDRISPSQYQGAVDALVRQGHLDRSVDGLQDRLALTDAGEAALRDHAAWLEDALGMG